ncbi:MAG: hypothetical protein AB2404_04330 [Planifilum fimeticola]
MTPFWRRIGWVVTALLFAAGCASPSRANVPSAGEDSTAVQKVILAQPAGEEEELKLKPVDPITLEDLPGYKPVRAGTHFDRAVSPDGGKLALVAWPSSDFEEGVLRIIDLKRWEERTADFTLRGPVEGFAFASDGETLYWLMPDREDPSLGLPGEFGLYHFGLRDRKPTRIARLPRSFEPREMVILAGGDLAVYGVIKEKENRGGRVYTFDPMSGNIRSQVSLKGVKDETVHLTGQADPPVIESHKPAIAWDLRKEMLYIVGGEPERVIQVDLGQGKVIRNQTVRYRSPLWEKIFYRLFPEAEAKWMSGTFRHAQLSPDGRRLFVTGRKDDVVEDSGEWTQKSEYFGLGVIDLETFEGRRLDLDAEMIKLSPDGGRLLLAGPWSEERGDQGPEKRGGLVIVDAERIRVLGRLGSGVNFEPVGFSPDVRHAYVMTGEGVKVLDLETRRILSERDGVELLIIEQRRYPSTKGPRFHRFPLKRARESGDDFRLDST